MFKNQLNNQKHIDTFEQPQYTNPQCRNNIESCHKYSTPFINSQLLIRF